MEFQLLPIALSLFLFEVPAIVRRLKKLYYVPIYFSVFPLRELNSDLATYLGEDFVGAGTQLSESSAEHLRKRIIVVAIVSMGISALLTPLLVGFFSAFYMPEKTFFQFLGILMVSKAFLVVKSVINFHHHAIGSTRNRWLLGVIYFCYLGVVFEMLRSAYCWTSPFVAGRQWLALVSATSALVFGKAVAGMLLLSVLTTILVALITDRELRTKNARDE